MKRLFYVALLITVLNVSCSSNKGLSLLVVNPMDQQRNDAILILSSDEISGWLDVPEGKVPLLSLENGEPLPTQLDDVDKDGVWDELFALIDLGPNGEENLMLSLVDPESYPTFKARTNLRLGANQPGYPELPRADRLEGISFHNYSGVTGAAFQMEGPAWENDRVGFRNYLDQRNGMDIFGKLTAEMVLDSVGIKGRSSYHEPADWGMDVLKVGTSLGAGSIGYMYNDSIYRVGDNGSGSYEVVFEGPLRSRFALAFNNWELDGTPLNISHQIEIAAGRRCYQSFVTYNGSGMHLDLVAGIVNMKSDTVYTLKLNENFSGLMTHDFQAEDTSLLAMALIVPSDYLKSTGQSKESGEGITQTYYTVLNARPDQPVPYRFYALWEREDPRWTSLDEVISFLQSEADRWAYSVIVQPIP